MGALVPEWLGIGALAAQPRALLETHRTLNSLSYAQVVDTNLPKLLHWEDRNSMAHSIESRVPFLDYRLVEFALGLPDEFKLSEGITKRVMREGMEGILPEPIRTRMDKKGFVTPEAIWLRERQPEAFRGAFAKGVHFNRRIRGRYRFTEVTEDAETEKSAVSSN